MRHDEVRLARKARAGLSGAVYYILDRGDRQKAIFLIPVEVRLKNGETIALRHQLQFAIPRGVREED